MSQDIYKTNPDIGFPGLEQGIGDRFARSFVNKSEIIPFGRAVVKEFGVENGVKLPASSLDTFEGIAIAARGEQTGDRFELSKNIPVLKRGSIIIETEQTITSDDNVFIRFKGKQETQTLVFSADLIAGNKINLKLDGISMPEITFATSHLATMTAIATQILATFPQIASCTVGGANNRTLMLTHSINGKNFVITNAAVTSGASQATITITEIIASISDNERGKFRKDQDLDGLGNPSAVLVPNVKFRGNSVNSLAEIDINIV